MTRALSARRGGPAAVAAATLIALAACTPSGVDPTPPPTAAPSASPTPPTTHVPSTPPGTPDPLDPLDPPLDPGAAPTEPGDDASGGPVLTWADGTPVDVVPLDTGVARRLDPARLRTVARPEAAAGHELDLLDLGDDGSALVADGTLSGDIDIAATLTSRLRLEGPGGVREIDLGRGEGRVYGGRVLDDGDVAAWRFAADDVPGDEFFLLRAGSRRAETFSPGGRTIVASGLLARDGTLTTWDGRERATGATLTDETRVVAGERCGDDCFWSTQGEPDAGESGADAAGLTAELVRTADGSAEVVARIPAGSLLLGADGDLVALEHYPVDALGWEVIVLDLAARTATSVSDVQYAAFADGRLAWTGMDPSARLAGAEGPTGTGDVHVLDVASGALARIPQPRVVGNVLVAGDHVA